MALTDAERSQVVVDDTTAPRISLLLSWLAGVLGAATSLAVGELLDRLSANVTSLVIGVGNLVVDITPGSVVATSINTLGTLQKPLLLGGITVGTIAVGGFLGTRSRESNRPLVVGFGAFGLFGAWVTGRDELTSTSLSFAAALIAAAIGALVAVGLLRVAARDREQVAADRDAPFNQTTGRRDLITFGTAAAGALVLTGAGRIGRTSAAETARNNILTARTADSIGPGVVDPTNLPTGQFDNLVGLTPRITRISPSDDFYVIDEALTKPQVDPAAWSLSIDGEYVDNPISFTYDELLARDQVSREVTLACVSNSVGGPLVDNAIWTGIALSELLEEAGVQDPTNFQQQFYSVSVDGFDCGFPLPLAFDGRTAMLALMMNGEPLPVDHGFPARIVVAGLYGFISATKWVERITITDWEEVDGFWQRRGWDKLAPIKTQSRIDLPLTNDNTLTAGLIEMGGVAFSPTLGIERVELVIQPIEDVRANGLSDDLWTEVELAEVTNDETWAQWRFDWDATPGEHVLRVRATDKTGFTQTPQLKNTAPNGAEGYHRINVTIR